MGRPPCCDKISVKKGPWTPEEDIILVSYIQQHGPGNWRSVPPNTGLLRCSKSCRLRWTNYLRPGIKRGNFTEQEEKMIIHLQALLGNRWAAMANYLPQRTDNDIKNYWNTYLKKKLKNGGNQYGVSSFQSETKGQWERRLQTDIRMAKQALSEALSVDNLSFSTDSKDSKPSETTTYASSAENISRLLENWKKTTPEPLTGGDGSADRGANSADTVTQSSVINGSSSEEGAISGETPPPHQSFDSFFSFSNNSCHDSIKVEQQQNVGLMTTENSVVLEDENKPNLADQVPLTLIDKWLLDVGLF